MAGRGACVLGSPGVVRVRGDTDTHAIHTKKRKAQAIAQNYNKEKSTGHTSGLICLPASGQATTQTADTASARPSPDSCLQIVHTLLISCSQMLDTMGLSSKQEDETMKHYYMIVEHMEEKTRDTFTTAEHEHATSYEEAVKAIDESDAEAGYKVIKAELVAEMDKQDNRLFSRLQTRQRRND